MIRKSLPEASSRWLFRMTFPDTLPDDSSYGRFFRKTSGRLFCMTFLHNSSGWLLLWNTLPDDPSGWLFRLTLPDDFSSGRISWKNLPEDFWMTLLEDSSGILFLRKTSGWLFWKTFLYDSSGRLFWMIFPDDFFPEVSSLGRENHMILKWHRSVLGHVIFRHCFGFRLSICNAVCVIVSKHNVNGLC